MRRARTRGLPVAVAASLARTVLGLPPARTRRVLVESDLAVPMSDGVVLYAHRWYPVDDPRAPIVLIRTPYGRGGLPSVIARVFAEAGYPGAVPSCRGTFGS